MPTSNEFLRLSELRQGDLVRFHDLHDGYFDWAPIADGRMAHIGECTPATAVTPGGVAVNWTYSTSEDKMPPLLVFGMRRDGTVYPDCSCWELYLRGSDIAETAVPATAEEPVGRRLDRRPRPSQPKETPMPGLTIGVYNLDATEHLFKDKAAYQSFIGELSGALTLQPQVVLMAGGQPVALMLSQERMAEQLSAAIKPYLGNPGFMSRLNDLFAQFTP